MWLTGGDRTRRPPPVIPLQRPGDRDEHEGEHGGEGERAEAPQPVGEGEEHDAQPALRAAFFASSCLSRLPAAARVATAACLASSAASFLASASALASVASRRMTSSRAALALRLASSRL